MKVRLDIVGPFDVEPRGKNDVGDQITMSGGILLTHCAVRHQVWFYPGVETTAALRHTAASLGSAYEVSLAVVRGRVRALRGAVIKG
jgi:hypothetical protein